MKNVLIGFVLGLAIAIPAVAFGAGALKDATFGTVTADNAIVHDSVTVGNRVTANQYEVGFGGAGYDWRDEGGNMIARVISGEFADPMTLDTPAPTLLLRRAPAELWFKGDGGWTRLSP